jgi:hypothetical protein
MTTRLRKQSLLGTFDERRLFFPRSSPWNPFRSILQRMNRVRQAATQDDDCEPSEEAIARLMEMRFTRDHSWDALDSVRSNRVELAVAYAPAHPVSSPATIEGRRTERANRRRQRGPQPQEMEAEENTLDETQAATVTLWIPLMWIFHSGPGKRILQRMSQSKRFLVFSSCGRLKARMLKFLGYFSSSVGSFVLRKWRLRKRSPCP